MPRIKVETEELRWLSHQLAEANEQLQVLQRCLAGAWSRLQVSGWKVQQRDLVEPQWQAARSRVRQLVDDADMLSRQLAECARRLEEADQVGLAAVGQVAAQFAALRRSWQSWLRQVQPGLTFPKHRAQRLLRLGGTVVDVPTVTTLPTALGGLAAGLLAGEGKLLRWPAGWKRRLEPAGTDAMTRAKRRPQ